jgi:hypothetical protein
LRGHQTELAASRAEARALRGFLSKMDGVPGAALLRALADVNAAAAQLAAGVADMHEAALVQLALQAAAAAACARVFAPFCAGAAPAVDGVLARVYDDLFLHGPFPPTPTSRPTLTSCV